MKSIITILIASIGILGAQTKTVGPSGEGITSGTRSAFLDALGGTSAGKSLFQMSGTPTSGQVPTWNGSAWAAATPSGGSFASLAGNPTDNALLSSELGLKVNTADLSTTGGANKVAKFDANGDFNFGPLSGGSTIADGLANINIPVAAQIQMLKANGAVGAYSYLMDGHSGGDEWFAYSPRFCYYFNQGFQFGQPYGVTAREPRFVYFNPLGTGNSGDPYRESISLNFNSNWFNGSTAVQNYAGIQWKTTSAYDGEFQFWTGMTTQPMADGKLASTTGAQNPLSLTNAGPKLPSGKILTFADGSTMSTAPNLQARTGNITLVGGTKTVADTSVTNKTNVLYTRRSAGGTIGDLSYSTTPGSGFTITSSSSTETSRLTYLLVEDAVEANAPVISGVNTVTDTLTATSGGGSGSFQWYSNSVPVSGETGSTYVIRVVDIGLPITCREDGVSSNTITAWHPDDESGYFADYRADVGVLNAGGSSAVNGEAVATWQDQSGNARHLSQSVSGSRPLLDTSGTGGRPTFIDFDATDDTLARTITVARPYSIFMVAEADDVIANRRYFSAGSTGSRMIISQDTTTTARFSNGTNNLDATGQVNLDSRHILFGKTSASANEFKVDGNTSLTNAFGSSADGSEIVASQSAGGGGADIKAYALLIYTADLDTDAQIRVRKYLKAKWSTP